MTDEEGHDPVAARIQDIEGCQRVLAQVARKIRIQHARMGQPMPVWQDGRVEWIVPPLPAEEEAVNSRP